jgi:hypothetical protein
MFDEITNVTDGAIEFGLFLAPNIFAEIALTKNWMFFGGASHNLNCLHIHLNLWVIILIQFYKCLQNKLL